MPSEVALGHTKITHASPRTTQDKHKAEPRALRAPPTLLETGSRLAQDSSRHTQDRPILSKTLQHSPRLLKIRTRQTHDRPRAPWALPKTAQDGLKTRPRRAQARAKSFLDCLAWLLPSCSDLGAIIIAAVRGASGRHGAISGPYMALWGPYKALGILVTPLEAS